MKFIFFDGNLEHLEFIQTDNEVSNMVAFVTRNPRDSVWSCLYANSQFRSYLITFYYYFPKLCIFHHSSNSKLNAHTRNRTCPCFYLIKVILNTSPLNYDLTGLWAYGSISFWLVYYSSDNQKVKVDLFNKRKATSIDLSHYQAI